MRDQSHNRDLVLAAMPGRQSEIVASTGLSAATVNRWCEDAVARKLAHIGDWYIHPNGGPLRPVYRVGPGKQAKKPFVLRDPAKRQARYVRRMRTSGEWEHVLAKRRARHACAAPKVDALHAVFFRDSRLRA